MHKTRIFVRPTEGRIVRFPDNRKRTLKSSGETVLNNTFWRRRIAGKDVILGNSKTIETDKKKSKT